MALPAPHRPNAGSERHVRTRRALLPRSGGVSLVELMVVLAIMLILFGIGIPSLRGFIRENRLVAATQDLFVAVQTARSEALARGARVDLVPAADGDWAAGWLVFVDANGDRQLQRGESVVLRHAALAAGIRVKADFTDGRRPYLAYGAAGRTVTDTGPA
ncbi:prepilin-type N-terminal cleavage/methylation domain-containing protein, partial [Oxalobacteraceae bacterium OM1]